MSNLSNEPVTNERLEEYLDKRMCNVTEELRIIVRELLAYREAQGKVVGWKWRLVDMASSETSAWSICLLPSSPGGGAGFETESIPLFAAPKLPAVPPELTKAKLHEMWDEKLDKGERFNDSFREGYEYCRALMVAEAPKPNSDNVTDNATQQFESLSKRSANG